MYTPNITKLHIYTYMYICIDYISFMVQNNANMAKKQC